MCKILFRQICTQNKIAKLFADYFRTCHYIELEPTKIKNAKTSTAFSKKRWIYRKRKVFVEVWWDPKILKQIFFFFSFCSELFSDGQIKLLINLNYDKKCCFMILSSSFKQRIRYLLFHFFFTNYCFTSFTILKVY